MSSQKSFAINGDVLVTFFDAKTGDEISEERAREIAGSNQYSIDLEKKLVFDVSNNMEVVCEIKVDFEIHKLLHEPEDMEG